MKQSYVRLLAGAAALGVAVAAALLLAALATYYYLAPTLPDVASLRDVRLQVPLRVYSRDGRLLAQIGEQRRIPVRFEDVPQRLVQAFLAAEDDRFFQHGGIDTAGLARAVLTAGGRGGGSTITMQLARNMFLTPEKQLRRKLREIFLALRIEREFTKQEILTLYLNKIFLGQRAYGVAAAAEVYFGRQLAELTLPQIATIAGLPQAPSVLNPIASPERSRRRRGYVLRRMADLGVISEAERAAADAAPVESQEHGPRVEVDAPYVAEMVRTQLAEQHGEEIYTAGYRVVTTIDSRMQHAADWSLRAALLEYDRRHGYRGPVATVNAADAAAVADALARRGSVGGLAPAVVVAVAERGALVELRGARRLSLPWENGLAWARRVDARGNPRPAPKSAADVVAVGDLVYVLPAGGNLAYLAQVPLVQGAFVSLDPQDGAITALAGGFDFYHAEGGGRFNRAVQARRQPGSAFKPFIYSGALEAGFTPASVILDAPVVIDAAGMEEMWRPENDSRRFYGPTRLRDALARSRNLVSIRILRAIGVDYAVDYATRFGFSKAQLPPNLTLALGTAQITPLELTTGYAVFANGGFRVAPYLVDRIEDATGAVLFQAAPRIASRECVPEVDSNGLPVVAPAATSGSAPPAATAATPPAAAPPPAAAAAPPVADGDAPPPVLPPSTSGAVEAGVTRRADLGDGTPACDARQLAPQAISVANAWLTTDLMRDVIRRGTGTRALALRRNDIAGKTGTSNEGRDTWFAGFNADVVAAAWVGFDQERSLGSGEEGGRTALPMWLYFMGETLAGRPERRLPQPQGIVTARISPATGELAGTNDPDAIFESFLAGRLPGEGGTHGDGAAAANSESRHAAEEPIF